VHISVYRSLLQPTLQLPQFLPCSPSDSQQLQKYPTIRRLYADFQTVTQPELLKHLSLHYMHWGPVNLPCIRLWAYCVLSAGEIRLGFVVEEVTLWQDLT